MRYIGTKLVVLVSFHFLVSTANPLNSCKSRGVSLSLLLLVPQHVPYSLLELSTSDLVPERKVILDSLISVCKNRFIQNFVISSLVLLQVDDPVQSWLGVLNIVLVNKGVLVDNVKYFTCSVPDRYRTGEIGVHNLFGNVAAFLLFSITGPKR
jgi:hypothetical protein